MIEIYVCPAEEYHLSHWTLIGEYPSIHDAEDELASPSFAVLECMIAEIRENHRRLSEMFYSDGQWISCDNGSIASQLIGQNSVLDWWLIEEAPSRIVLKFSKIFSVQKIVDLFAISIVHFSPSAHQLRMRELCDEITVSIMKERSIEYSVKGIPRDLVDILKNFGDLDRTPGHLQASYRYIAVTQAICKSIEKKFRVSAAIAQRSFCDFVRTQITLPVFLKAIAKKVNTE